MRRRDNASVSTAITPSKRIFDYAEIRLIRAICKPAVRNLRLLDVKRPLFLRGVADGVTFCSRAPNRGGFRRRSNYQARGREEMGIRIEIRGSQILRILRQYGKFKIPP